MSNTSDRRLDGPRNRNRETSPSSQPNVELNASFNPPDLLRYLFVDTAQASKF
jgi:hypothetical protein